MSTDPLGHELLASRIEQIPGELAGMIVRGLPQLRPSTLASEAFVVTGTRCFEAHAHYFAHLVNLYTERTATHLPLSAFLRPTPELAKGKTLVVFSQGVSEGAQVALSKHREFAHVVLVTSTTPMFARTNGMDARADLISDVVEAGGDLILFPMGEELSTRLRVVGPMCGYLVAMQILAQFADCNFKIPKPDGLLPLLDLNVPVEMERQMLERPEAYQCGMHLVCTAPISDFAHNLAFKFMEGLNWQCPQILDFLQFAQGRFPYAAGRSTAVVFLQGELPEEAGLVERGLRMANKLGLSPFVLRAPASDLHSIFGFESMLNKLVLKLMICFAINQREWAGRGIEGIG